MKLYTLFLQLVLGFSLLFNGDSFLVKGNEAVAKTKIETFTFYSNGTHFKGKIYLPESFSKNKQLPAIFLIDFTEQHFKIAKDEFEKVIDGVNQIPDFDALVVTLEEILDIDAEPDSFEDHYTIFKDLSNYVENKYSTNNSKTFIGKGSESGVVLMALLDTQSNPPVFENFIATDPSGLYGTAFIDAVKKFNTPIDMPHKKLHFSFSTSNDYKKCTTLIDLLKEKQFPWLTFESKYYSDSNYENTYPVSYAEGLKFIFNK
jgi:predicted alpha/beta superfamily hydrolase